MNTPHALLCDRIRAITSTRSADELAADESFWSMIRNEYARPTEFIHLEYGYYHPCSRAVLAAEMDAMQMAQRRGSHYKRNEMSADRENAWADLARLAGAAKDEVILTRNATEALNIVILGMPLQRGDEIVHSNQDYPSVVEALEQRAQRDGLTLKAVALPLEPESDDEVTTAFAAAITTRTRAILITHFINITGQVLPVEKLCALARRHQLQIVIDAAHSFAQLDFRVPELDCDYLGASLHKWLGAPLGTGLLYVKRSRVAGLRPLFADTALPADSILKLAHFGNRPDSAHIGLREAIRWHEALSTPVKEARLRYLQRRWSRRARLLPNVHLLTPADPQRHGAIGAFIVDGYTPDAVAETLMAQHGIFVNAFQHEAVSGIRVTPGLPTSSDDVDKLASALETLAKRS
jgi:selenocysteine lyase/cysteine desulfurase